MSQLTQLTINSANTYSPSVPVFSSFTISITGTWVGTITAQLSLLGGSEWTDWHHYTSNMSATFTEWRDKVWLRIGFKTGDYVSGSAIITVTKNAITDPYPDYLTESEEGITFLAPTGDGSGLSNVKNIVEVIQPATDILTAAECTGTVINNYGQTVENTQTLPAAATGLNFIAVIATTGAGAFHIKSGAGDKIYFDGIALDDADKVSCTTPTVGDFITFCAFQTGADAYDWFAASGAGVWTDGGA